MVTARVGLVSLQTRNGCKPTRGQGSRSGWRLVNAVSMRLLLLKQLTNDSGSISEREAESEVSKTEASAKQWERDVTRLTAKLI